MKKKTCRRIIKRVIPVAIIAWLYWPLAALFLVSGVYDVLRQRHKKSDGLFKKYFLGNGTLTWIFSPINLLIDIICLPFMNQQIYSLEQLPLQHQEQINEIIRRCPKQDLIAAVNELKNESDRSMLLYKWYGHNIKKQTPLCFISRELL